MSYRLNRFDINEALNDSVKAFYDVFHKVYTQPKPTQPATTRMFLPSRFGEGEFSVRKLENVTLSSINVRFDDDVYLMETALDELFFVSVSLGAEVRFELVGQGGNRFPSRMLSLGYSQSGEIYKTAMSKNEVVQTLSFFFTKAQLHDYLREFDRPDLIKKLENANRMQIFERAALSSSHRYLIARLKKNPYQGLLEKLYFESIAGELLIALLESICGHENTVVYLTDRDRELLKSAKKLLLKDPQNPPTITQLAKSVGLNEDKLKKGFKALFNNTIFKTLTEYRMQQAIKYVRRNDMSIAEIAYDTGYENVSSFIAVFKKTYGKPPGMMRKEVMFSLPKNH